MKSILAIVILCTGCATMPTSSVQDAAKACAAGNVVAFETRSESGMTKFVCRR